MLPHSPAILSACSVTRCYWLLWANRWWWWWWWTSEKIIIYSDVTLLYFNIGLITDIRWLGGVVVRASDLWSTGCEFNSRPYTAGLVGYLDGWLSVGRWAVKPSRCVTSHLGQLSLPSLRRARGLGKSCTSLRTKIINQISQKHIPCHEAPVHGRRVLKLQASVVANTVLICWLTILPQVANFLQCIQDVLMW